MRQCVDGKPGGHDQPGSCQAHDNVVRRGTSLESSFVHVIDDGHVGLERVPRLTSEPDKRLKFPASRGDPIFQPRGRPQDWACQVSSQNPIQGETGKPSLD